MWNKCEFLLSVMREIEYRRKETHVDGRSSPGIKARRGAYISQSTPSAETLRESNRTTILHRLICLWLPNKCPDNFNFCLFPQTRHPAQAYLGSIRFRGANSRRSVSCNAPSTVKRFSWLGAHSYHISWTLLPMRRLQLLISMAL